jgi:hypothetical protein
LLPQRSGPVPRATGPGAIGLTTSQRYALPATTFSPEASPPIYTYSNPAVPNPSVAQTGLQRRTATIQSGDTFDPDNNAGRSAVANTSGSSRRIVRVNKRHASTWGGEIKAGLVAVYGYPGRKNPMFYIKVFLTIGLLVLLFAFVFLRPTQHTIVQAPVHEFLSPLEDSHGADHVHPELPPLTNKDLTIFTVFSPENAQSPEHSVHLRAVHSWLTRLASPSQVHVYVKDYTHCIGLHVLGVTCRVSSCWDEEFDAPRLVCLLTEANTRATTELMLYIDDHIILFEDILPALFRVGRLEKFLALGRSKPLTLKLDSNLDLDTWQHDLESAVFLDSSDEQQNDLLGQVSFEQRAQARESKSLHYIAYARKDLDLSAIPTHLLMDGGSYTEHGWESAFLATMLVNDDVHVVDVSTAVTAIEFSHLDTSNHTSLLNEHNRILSTNFTGLSDLHYAAKQANMIAHLALGRLENAHYVLTGRCPTCSLKENRESDLPLILLRKANAARQIIVIATNADYLALTFNWICRAEMLGITNFVMLAEDRVAYRILRKMNVAVVLRKDAPYRKPAAAVNSKDFQETLYLRALFFNQVVSLGFSLIMTHLDTVNREEAACHT